MKSMKNDGTDTSTDRINRQQQQQQRQPNTEWRGNGSGDSGNSKEIDVLNFKWTSIQIIYYLL